MQGINSCDAPSWHKFLWHPCKVLILVTPWQGINSCDTTAKHELLWRPCKARQRKGKSVLKQRKVTCEAVDIFFRFLNEMCQGEKVNLSRQSIKELSISHICKPYEWPQLSLSSLSPFTWHSPYLPHALSQPGFYLLLCYFSNVITTYI